MIGTSIYGIGLVQYYMELDDYNEASDDYADDIAIGESQSKIASDLDRMNLASKKMVDGEK